MGFGKESAAPSDHSIVSRNRFDVLSPHALLPTEDSTLAVANSTTHSECTYIVTNAIDCLTTKSAIPKNGLSPPQGWKLPQENNSCHSIDQSKDQE